MTEKTIALLLALLLTGILYACDSVPDTSDINSDSIVSETGSPSDTTDTFLSLIQEKLEISQKGLNELTELRNGLMQQLFT